MSPSRCLRLDFRQHFCSCPADNNIPLGTNCDVLLAGIFPEGIEIELELSANDANVCIHSRDSRKPIKQSRQLEAVFLTRDSSNGKCIRLEVSDVVWPFDKELYIDFGIYRVFHHICYNFNCDKNLRNKKQSKKKFYMIVMSIY